MRQITRSILAVGCSILTVSCGLVSSQAINSSDRNAPPGDGQIVLKNPSPNPPPDVYEIARAGAEKLNGEPVARIEAGEKTQPLSRREIREALIGSSLIGESKTGKVGGGRIVHFSHTCDLLVGGKLYRVIYAPVVVQLDSFARRSNHTLIYDASMRLIHDLTSDDAPLFCDGNRLFFSDYEMTVFYGEPAKEAKGNVLIFTNGAKDIEGRIASLNFYRFKTLIY